jgi:hypothetical protein
MKLINQIVDNSLYLRRIIRESAKARNNCPIDIIEGDFKPKITGRSYYWTTPSGKTEIRHPNAYRWPKQYHCSTISIEVGADYLWRLLNDE